MLSVLSALAAQDGLCPTDLVRLLGRDREEVERVVSRLRSEGLLARETDALSLTSQGHAAFETRVRDIALAFDHQLPMPSGVAEDPTLPVNAAALFQDNFVVTFAVSPARVAPLIPPPFAVETANGKAFVSVTLNSVKHIRLAGLPRLLGVNYYDVIYRAHVVYGGGDGTTHRGVFFLRTDSNDPFLNFWGRRLREFRPHQFQDSSISMIRQGDRVVTSVRSGDGKGDTVCVCGLDAAAFGSRLFASEAEARERVIDVFSAFATDPADGGVWILEIIRNDEEVRVVRCLDSYFDLFETPPFGGESSLDHVFYVGRSSWKWLPLKKDLGGRP